MSICPSNVCLHDPCKEDIQRSFTSAASVVALVGYLIQLSCFMLIRCRSPPEADAFAQVVGSHVYGTALFVRIN